MTLPQATGYGWNGHRYFDLDTGQFVSKATVRNALESLIDVSAVRMNGLSEKLKAGVVSLADWQSGMMDMIKQSHVAASALANGGWAQMTQSDWGYVGSLVKEQYQYLRNFAKQIVDGTQPLDGRFLVRTDLYGDAANTTYSAMQTRAYMEDGYDEERRTRENDPNVCDDCVEYADMGWQPIGTLPEPGNDSVCLKRCRCEKEYRKSGEE